MSRFIRRSIDYFGLSGPTELIGAALFSLFLLILGILNSLHYRFDADEPQHLHVIWSWTQGLVQYRDVFDNHMPLFHILLAPIGALIGERPTILHWMRFVIWPAHLIAVWATYRIGSLLFSQRVGFWSVILVASFPSYHCTSLEFRPDNLWAPLWLVCLVVLLAGRLTARRALVAGLLLGLCFGLSMKSTVLLISLLVSALALAFVARKNLKESIAPFVHRALLFLFATTLVPVTIVIFFWIKGVWADFLNCVFAHQFLGHLFHRKQIFFAAASLLLLPVIIYVARCLIRTASDFELGVRRAFVLLVTCFYLLVLRTFWPLIARDDYLPWYPLAFVLLTAALLAASNYLEKSGQSASRIFGILPVPAFLVVIELVVLCQTRPFWKDKTVDETNLLRDVLSLTTRQDYVFDSKGETVFRQRCFRPILETITRKRIRRGLISDTAPQRCVETRTCLAATGMIERFSPETREFLERNYLPIAKDLRVAGVRLQETSKNSKRCDFDIVIPAEYRVVARDGAATGTLDGSVYQGPRFLPAGRHTFESTSDSGDLIVLWARAVEHNFSPFSLASFR